MYAFPSILVHILIRFLPQLAVCTPLTIHSKMARDHSDTGNTVSELSGLYPVHIRSISGPCPVYSRVGVRLVFGSVVSDLYLVGISSIPGPFRVHIRYKPGRSSNRELSGASITLPYSVYFCPAPVSAPPNPPCRISPASALRCLR